MDQQLIMGFGVGLGAGSLAGAHWVVGKLQKRWDAYVDRAVLAKIRTMPTSPEAQAMKRLAAAVRAEHRPDFEDVIKCLAKVMDKVDRIQKDVQTLKTPPAAAAAGFNPFAKAAAAPAAAWNWRTDAAMLQHHKDIVQALKQLGVKQADAQATADKTMESHAKQGSQLDALLVEALRSK
jgi:hypothetical protein